MYLSYSQLEKDWIDRDYLYLIAITAVSIAIKLEEIYKVSTRTIVKDLGKNVYTSNQVLSMEKKILTRI